MLMTLSKYAQISTDSCFGHSSYRLAVLFIFLLPTLLCSSCLSCIKCALPDFIPRATNAAISPAIANAYCTGSSGRRLVSLQVNNQGKAKASTIVEITYLADRSFPGGSDTLNTGKLKPGQTSKILSFTPPSNCFNPMCEFRITINPNGAISESNMFNNAITGSCGK